MTTTLLNAAQAFIVDECNLLDERRFDEWLSLFDDDAYYWMPCDPNVTDRQFDSAIINDDYADLKKRVYRLGLPTAHADFPTPLGCRSVSSFAVEQSDPIIVRTKLVMHEFQRRAYAQDDYRVFCATVRYGLREAGATFRIRFKRVDLIDAGGSRTVMPTPL
ncbi:MAG: aromatic-ring-hydroxylating dioxygenase subunit beta [Pseudomonadota bacterium]